MTRTLVWDKGFLRAFRQMTRRNPHLRAKALLTLELLSQDPFHRALDTHKLKGILEGLWACSIDYDYRIVFELVDENRSGNEVILLIDIGTHDEVY